jgi:hypothetical protein
LSYPDQQSNQLKALSLSSFYNFSSAGDKEREGWRAKGRIETEREGGRESARA